MEALRCADVTLQHGYRYFVGVSMADLSTNASFTTAGYANTYGTFEIFNYITAPSRSKLALVLRHQTVPRDDQEFAW
jgi:hypothetical protein